MLPPKTRIWASADDYAAGGATKIPMGDSEITEGAQPGVANVSAQEFNSELHGYSRATRHVRANAILPKRIYAAGAVADTGTAEFMTGSADGVIVCLNDGASDPLLPEDGVSLSFGRRMVTMGVGSGAEWIVTTERQSASNVDAAMFSPLRADFHDDPADWSSYVTIISGAAGLAVEGSIRGCGTSSIGYIFGYFVGGTPSIFCTRVLGPTAGSAAARTPPAGLGATWVEDARCHYRATGHLIVVAPVAGDTLVTVTTDDTTTWSAPDTIVAGQNPVFLDFSDEHEGWVLVTNDGHIYLCDQNDDPAVGANWVKQTTGAAGAFPGGTTFPSAAVSSAARVGDLFVMAVTAGSVGSAHWIVWTDDFFATYGHRRGPWTDVARAGQVLVYHNPALEVVGVSDTIAEIPAFI
jgi:hypothetical protein